MSDGAKQSKVTRDVGETDTLSGSFMEHYELKMLRGNEDQNVSRLHTGSDSRSGSHDLETGFSYLLIATIWNWNCEICELCSKNWEVIVTWH